MNPNASFSDSSIQRLQSFEFIRHSTVHIINKSTTQRIDIISVFSYEDIHTNQQRSTLCGTQVPFGLSLEKKYILYGACP